MCQYAEKQYKVHYVCLTCRRSSKHHATGMDRACSECGTVMLLAGHDFAAPRRTDKSGWGVVAAVLTAGLRYDGFETCGCARGPEFRPRTSAQVRERRRLALRAGVDEAAMLAERAPDTLLRNGGAVGIAGLSVSERRRGRPSCGPRRQ